jgi:hypothetical protein
MTARHRFAARGRLAPGGLVSAWDHPDRIRFTEGVASQRPLGQGSVLGECAERLAAAVQQTAAPDASSRPARLRRTEGAPATDTGKRAKIRGALAAPGVRVERRLPAAAGLCKVRLLREGNGKLAAADDADALLHSSSTVQFWKGRASSAVIGGLQATRGGQLPPGSRVDDGARCRLARADAELSRNGVALKE